MSDRANTLVTHDSSFRALLARGKEQGFGSHLSQIFSANYGRAVLQENQTTTEYVRTFTLKKQDVLFERLKEDKGAELLEILHRARKRHPKGPYSANAVYFIVGIKIAYEIRSSRGSTSETLSEAGASVPITTAVMAGTGVVLPVNIDPEANISYQQSLTNNVSSVALGARIFALEYKLVKLHRDWKMTPKPVALGDTLTVGQHEGFYNKELLSSGEEETSDDEDADVNLNQLVANLDDIEVGDLEYSCCLAEESNSIIVADLPL